MLVKQSQPLSVGFIAIWLTHENLTWQRQTLALWADKEAPDSSCFPDTTLHWARSCGNIHSSPGQAPSLRLTLTEKKARVCYLTRLWGLRWVLLRETGRELKNWKLAMSPTGHELKAGDGWCSPSCPLGGAWFSCTPHVLRAPGTRKYHLALMKTHPDDG